MPGKATINPMHIDRTAAMIESKIVAPKPFNKNRILL
jgi:hypothetical protein